MSMPGIDNSQDLSGSIVLLLNVVRQIRNASFLKAVTLQYIDLVAVTLQYFQYNLYKITLSMCLLIKPALHYTLKLHLKKCIAPIFYNIKQSKWNPDVALPYICR